MINAPAHTLDQITPARLPETVWSLLEQSIGEVPGPFRTPVLISINGEEPDGRVVILRNVDPGDRLLECYTDTRSAKIRQLTQREAICFVFYDPVRKLQLRLRGEARIHTNDEISKSRWAQLSVYGKRQYSQIVAPGERIKDQGDPSAVSASAGIRTAKSHFAVLRTHVTQIEWLLLGRDHHTRMISIYRNNCWSTDRVMP